MAPLNPASESQPWVYSGQTWLSRVWIHLHTKTTSEANTDNFVDIIPVIMAGIIGIYGLVVSVLISNDLKQEISLFASFIQLGAGLAVGLAGLAAGFAIGIVGDAGVRGTAQQPRLFVGMILILIFAEVLGMWNFQGEPFLCCMTRWYANTIDSYRSVRSYRCTPHELANKWCPSLQRLNLTNLWQSLAIGSREQDKMNAKLIQLSGWMWSIQVLLHQCLSMGSGLKNNQGLVSQWAVMALLRLWHYLGQP